MGPVRGTPKILVDQTQLGVDNDPDRVGPAAAPDGQLRIVRPHCARADDDGVGESPHSMAV
jgi:hypothetical protein